MDVNQRYPYPAVARDLSYDSAVFGTSSIRLLHPDLLEEELGGSFTQFAMNSATPFEQSQIADLFLCVRSDVGQAPKTIQVAPRMDFPIGTGMAGGDVIRGVPYRAVRMALMGLVCRRKLTDR